MPASSSNIDFTSADPVFTRVPITKRTDDPVSAAGAMDYWTRCGVHPNANPTV